MIYGNVMNLKSISILIGYTHGKFCLKYMNKYMNVHLSNTVYSFNLKNWGLALITILLVSYGDIPLLQNTFHVVS